MLWRQHRRRAQLTVEQRLERGRLGECTRVIKLCDDHLGQVHVARLNDCCQC
jgi:hypothetical protein